MGLCEAIDEPAEKKEREKQQLWLTIPIPKGCHECYLLGFEASVADKTPHKSTRGAQHEYDECNI